MVKKLIAEGVKEGVSLLGKAKKEGEQIVNELSYFRKNRHRFVSDLSGKIVS